MNKLDFFPDAFGKDLQHSATKRGSLLDAGELIHAVIRVWVKEGNHYKIYSAVKKVFVPFHKTSKHKIPLINYYHLIIKNLPGPDVSSTTSQTFGQIF